MMREVSKSKSLPLFILFLVSMFLLSQWLKIIKKVSSVSVITTFYLCHLNANAPNSSIVSSILNIEKWDFFRDFSPLCLAVILRPFLLVVVSQK